MAFVALSAYCFAMLQSPDRHYDPWEINAGSLTLCISTFGCAAVCKSLTE